MNSMACVYIKTLEDLEALATGSDFRYAANKFRCFVLIAAENPELEKTICASIPAEAGRLLRQTGVLRAYECVVPHLIRPELSDLAALGERVPVMGEARPFWLGDVDMWYNFPESWIAALKPQFPHAYFNPLVFDDAVKTF